MNTEEVSNNALAVIGFLSCASKMRVLPRSFRRRTSIQAAAIAALRLAPLGLGSAFFQGVASAANTSSRLAPSFSLPQYSEQRGIGPVLSLEALRGQWVYLDFWASWCIPCRLSFPFMNELHRSLGPKGLTVLAVGLDKQRQRMSDFLKETPADFSIVWDLDGQVAKLYQVAAMPTSFIISPKGMVMEEHKGFNQAASLAVYQSLRRYLETPQ